jgi:hypothetical protein
MPLVICYYEDDKFDRFYPVTILRPVYTLRAGIVPLFRRGVFPGRRSLSFGP